MPPTFPALPGWEDVFHEILSYLRPSEYFVFDDDDEVATRFFLRRTLLSLALSCHAFSDPALDMLWHSLDNVHPLLKLLPNYQRHDSIYYLEGDISPEAWSRLKTYAARVRSITFSRKAGIDGSAWWTVLQQCQGTPLLPNLRKLHTIKLNAVHIFALRAFVSTSLRDVFLEFYEDLEGDRGPNSMAPIAGSALQEFSINAPDITKLCLYPDLTIGRADLMCLSRFTQLEELYLNDNLMLDEELLSMINGLKKLTALKLSVLLRGPPESTPAQAYEFHNLTRLDLCGLPAHLARFILASSMPRLNDLSIWFGSHLSDGIDTALASMSRHIGPSHTLSHFTMQLNGFTRPPRSLMTLLEPLLSLSQLESVVVHRADSLPLRDSDLARISRAWPHLRTLRLDQSSAVLSNPDREPGSIARPTLAGLVDLARGCPRLAALSLSELDASVLPPVASVPLMGHGRLDLCIENLVGAEEEETQLEVAVVLDRLFPRLDLEYGVEELRQYGSNVNPYTGESENVAKLLRAMQLGREHYPRGVEPLGRLESAY